MEGLLQFRGNPSRTWYGAGPVPENPEIAWTFEVGCGPSSVGGKVTQWCGSGWTGQPVVWEREDGVTELIFGLLRSYAARSIQATDASEFSI